MPSIEPRPFVRSFVHPQFLWMKLKRARKKAFKIKHSIGVDTAVVVANWNLLYFISSILEVDCTTNEQLKKLKAKQNEKKGNSQKHEIDDNAASECQTEPTDTSECGLHL